MPSKTVGVVGLGLIGGSLAKAIKARTDYNVLGYDLRSEVMAQAKAQRVLDGELTDGRLSDCEFVLIALYPDEVLAYCERNFAHMRPGTMVVDCAGVKTRLCAALAPLARRHALQFVGGHPMAGVERSGYENAFETLFDGATMILCPDGDSPLETLGAFFRFIGFGRVKITTPQIHDEIVAYTSQLAHLVSSAYVHSDTMQRRYGFSAGSFKDLTRVAKLNADMWTSLFFENRENLLKETDLFLEQLRRYRDALAEPDPAAMKELLQKGNALKVQDETDEQNVQ